MINIVDSSVISANSSRDDCLKAIANALVNSEIIKSEDVIYYYNIIEKINISNNLKINKYGQNAIELFHINGSSIKIDPSSYNRYKLIITDNSVMFYLSSSYIIVIGKTISLNEDESLGIIVCSGGSWYVFTDKMNTNLTSIIPISYSLTYLFGGFFNLSIYDFTSVLFFSIFSIFSL